jgi:hypothetical protein
MPNALCIIRYQKGVCLYRNQVNHKIPSTIKSLSRDINVFMPALKDYLLTQSFFSVKEFTPVSGKQITCGANP